MKFSKTILLLLLTQSIYCQICDAELVFLSNSGVCNNSAWDLVFEDNFNGNSLDLTKWDVAQGVVRDFNFDNEKQWYSPDNIDVSNGVLKLWAKKESYTGSYLDYSTTPPTVQTETFLYTSGSIQSKMLFSEGKLEARCKYLKGKGFGLHFGLLVVLGGMK